MKDVKAMEEDWQRKLLEIRSMQGENATLLYSVYEAYRLTRVAVVTVIPDVNSMQ